MPNSGVFELICERLEAETSLDRLEARGTLRLSLKAAGLEASSVNADEMKTVILRILPPELEARGIEEGASVCGRLTQALADVAIDDSSDAESPESVFARLGGS